MDRSARFWDRIAKRYAKQPIEDEAAYQKKLQVTQDYLRPDMAVLEFGCGTGSTAIVHAPHVQHIDAIDISARMIAIAQGKGQAGGISNVSFQQAGIEDYDAAPDSLDAVLGLSILHLLKDKEAAIDKVHRLLKPGGIFASSTACLGDSMAFIKWIAPVGEFLGLMPLVKVFTEKELQDSITAAGFEIDYQWQPARGKAVFIVAKKPGP